MKNDITYALRTPPKGPLQVSATTPAADITFSLIIPTYNESDNIAKIVTQLTTLLDTFIPGDYELILVDDDSPDLTWVVAQALTKTYPQLQVMRRQQERGLSSAVIRGWQIARGKVLGVIDADLQHPPDVLLQLLQAALDGADLAIASRNIEGGGVSNWSILRRFLSRGAQILGLIVCPGIVGRVTDPMSGYFVVRRRAIAGPKMNPVGYKILLEVIGRGNIQDIAEVGYIFQERKSGESKVTWKQYLDYLGHLANLRFSATTPQKTPSHIEHLHQKFPTQKFPPKKFPTRRLYRYGLVGFSGVFVDMGILYLLFSIAGLGLITSKVIAAEIAMISNFFWNDIWTFPDLVGQQTGWSNRLKRLLKFNIVCAIGLFFDVLLLNVLFNRAFHQSLPYIANLLAIGVTAIWNFWLNLKLSWRVTAVSKSNR